jgi:hypothetical protein
MIPEKIQHGENDRRTDRKAYQNAFYICAVALTVILFGGLTFLNPNILDITDPRRQHLIYFATFFTKPVMAICTLLLPVLAAKARFSLARWFKVILWTVGIGINLFGAVFVVRTLWGTVYLPQTVDNFYLYIFVLKPIYLFVAELPLALAVAMGARREKAERTEPPSIPDEPHIEPSP